MSSTCPNCKSKLSCGCQKRIASNGATVCTMCLASYEASIRKKSSSSTGTDPSNVTILYNGPGKVNRNI